MKNLFTVTALRMNQNDSQLAAAKSQAATYSIKENAHA